MNCSGTVCDPQDQNKFEKQKIRSLFRNSNSSLQKVLKNEKMEGTVYFSILKSLRTILYQNIYDNHICHLKAVFILLLRNIVFANITR